MMVIEISYDNLIGIHENLFYSLIFLKTPFCVCCIYMHAVVVGCINTTIVQYKCFKHILEIIWGFLICVFKNNLIVGE